MKKIALLGHSHIHAIKRGIVLLDDKHKQMFDGSYFHFRQKQYLPHFEDEGLLNMNPELLHDLAEALSGAEIVLLTIIGNEHNVFGLANHPRPFDFILRGSDDHEIDQHAEFIPQDFVETAMLEYCIEGAPIFKTIRKLVPAETPIYQLQSPPPISDNGYILAHPDRYEKRFERHGVAPKNLRLKLWKLYSQIIQGYCADAGITYVPVPDAAKDDEGFLFREGWGNEPTHASPAYGKLVWQDLLDNVLKVEANE